ncbi:putative tRNA (uracil-O(2)-)-methyltransferase isoform X2 [Tamandua tetradactyla]|uniref:putative tRNA (uracil-O(2)-)-methyltransferase isoform X2 n=1 Tax=Tamandua tetradactyla TaxID=48850 RepID=UPI004053996C
MAEVGRMTVCDPGALLPGGFWAAVAVWLERPQVVNKRLCGASLEARRSVALPQAETRGPRSSAGPEQEERGTARPDQGSHEASRGHRPRAEPEKADGRHRQAEEQREAVAASLTPGDPGQTRSEKGDFPASYLDFFWEDFSRSLARGGNRELLAFLTRSWAGPQSEAQREVDVILRTVIPKMNPHCPHTAPRREVVVQDVFNGTITFLPLEEDEEGNLKVKMNNIYQIQLSQSKQEWFMSVLIFCPERWHSDGIVYPKPTWLGKELLAKLGKWSVEDKKSEFKSTLSLISVMKYSKVYQELKEKYKEMVKVWPEVTDPEKFVYEDVAIAAYLLILWEEERDKRKTTDKQSFVDLGCGNGLLAHILSSEGHPGRGIDVRRRKIWDMYGPQTQLEVCLIGKSRTYLPAAEVSIDAQRSQYIKGRQGCPESPPGEDSSWALCRAAAPTAAPRDHHRAQGAQHEDVPGADGLWLSGFRPRERADPVRNCAALPRDFIDRVVLQVANLLLGGAPPDGSLRTWNPGGSLTLAEVASKLDKETLQRLKRECGGLQTLLRNSHQVFEVLNGRVHIRDWREEKLQNQQLEAKRRLFPGAFKTRVCWFVTHHPDGCALPSDCCPFAHGPGELRPSQNTKWKKQVL